MCLLKLEKIYFRHTKKARYSDYRAVMYICSIFYKQRNLSLSFFALGSFFGKLSMYRIHKVCVALIGWVLQRFLHYEKLRRRARADRPERGKRDGRGDVVATTSAYWSLLLLVRRRPLLELSETLLVATSSYYHRGGHFDITAWCIIALLLYSCEPINGTIFIIFLESDHFALIVQWFTLIFWDIQFLLRENYLFRDLISRGIANRFNLFLK